MADDLARREFLRRAGACAGALAVPWAGAAGAGPAAAATNPAGGGTAVIDLGETRDGDMIYRRLGRTGARVSAIGLGGHHIGRQASEEESLRLIRAAIDGGITFLDNCWDYHNGGSETRMGLALQDGYRDKVFLMSKIDGRSKAAAARQIDESLRRLRTDRIDLMQHHEVLRLEDPDRILGEGGAQEALAAAQKAGKVRFIGFTGHKDPYVHLRMLDLAGERGVRFDAVQMPLNVMDAHFRSFGRDVLPRLVGDEIAVLGMKPLASGHILEAKAVTAEECLRYALSLPTAVVITGIDSLAVLRQALAVAASFKPLGEDEREALLARTATLAKSGRYERFKTGDEFDSTAKHPEWLG